MIQNIAQKEFTSALRDKRFVTLGLIIFLLVAMATITAISAHNTLQEQRVGAQSLADNNFKDQPDRHPHRVAHYGSYAFRPKSSLSFLDFGVDSFTGSMVYLEAHQQNSANFSQVQQSSSLIRFGGMTVALVLQMLLPLLIIFLCFSAFTLEREEGTLKLLLSQGVKPLTIARAKVRGYSKVLALVVIPSLILTSTFLFKLNGFEWRLNELARLAAFFLSYLVYFFIFLAGSVLVSAFSKSSRASLITLLGIWILSCVLLPKAMSNLGNSLFTAPTKAEMDARIHAESKNGIDGHAPHDQRASKLKEDLLRKYKVDSLSQLPVNYDGLVMAEGEKYSSWVYQRHFERLVNTYNNQNEVVLLSGFINPYSALKSVSTSIAGSDYRHYVDFLKAAEAYRYNLAQHLNGLQTTKVGYKDKEIRLDQAHWKEYPPFTYHTPSVGTALKSQLLPVAALLGWFFVINILFTFLFKNKFKIS